MLRFSFVFLACLSLAHGKDLMQAVDDFCAKHKDLKTNALAGQSRKLMKSAIGDMNEEIRCCPEGWFGFRDSCYYVEYATAMNFTEARTMCQGVGADLWVPNCNDEFQAVRSHCLSSPFVTWIGGIGEVIDGEMKCDWSHNQASEAYNELPWTLAMAPNYGWNTMNKCLSYGHNQMTYQQNGGATDRGVLWADCRMSTGRFAMCERNSTIIANKNVFQH